MRLDRKVRSIAEFGGYRLGSSVVYVTDKSTARRMPPSGQFYKGLSLTKYIPRFSWNDTHVPRSIMEDEREYESSLELD